MWQTLKRILFVSIITLTQPLQAIAQQPQPELPPRGYWPGPWHMWSDGPGWHFWWMGLPMMLLMMLAFAGIFYFVFVRRSSGGLHHRGPPWSMMDRQQDSSHSALQILGERFARGEIQKEEYEEKKSVLLSGS